MQPIVVQRVTAHVSAVTGGPRANVVAWPRQLYRTGTSLPAAAARSGRSPLAGKDADPTHLTMPAASGAASLRDVRRHPRRSVATTQRPILPRPPAAAARSRQVIAATSDDSTGKRPVRANAAACPLPSARSPRAGRSPSAITWYALPRVISQHHGTERYEHPDDGRASTPNGSGARGDEPLVPRGRSRPDGAALLSPLRRRR